ncbi:reactive intermediate/imine deaminase [Tenacibaculum sp. MAR_2009_124]|uniref:RidA family protein n=1 Tax=Tenacibaculum sp. MAR_2009_124 TaxID=1250059 RepID=UPI00089A2AD9|nr:Rid family detoxifying hydrolase [Tenacibaculum sp. MAR_2009_124]SEC93340.1 reactive intermediate/imine deaminase [Tenacibaculum sp. MAR_2009_124]
MKTKLIILVVLCSLNFSCIKKEKPNLTYHTSKLERKKNAPFSDAVEVGNTLYLSGQVGIHPDTKKLVPGGIEAETIQTFKNIEDVLVLHGSDMQHVVKCTVILADLNDFNQFNTIFRKYFPKNKPARTTFAADLLVDAKIEIDIIAVKADGFKDARVSK